MLDALLLVLALLPPPAQDEAARPPDPERLKTAVRELASAFAKGDAAARIRAIEAAAELPDPSVVAAIDDGLRDEDENVRGAAVTALRYMRHPSALEALHEELEHDRKFPHGVDHSVAIVKAIGEHGSTSSLAPLTRSLFSCTEKKVISARILALGNVRHVKSVESLFDTMKLAGPHKVQPFMDELRLSLVVLTGADQGRSQDLWMRWWNEHRKELAVLPEPPQLAKEDARRWDAFWGRSPMRERQEKRGERGGK